MTSNSWLVRMLALDRAYARARAYLRYAREDSGVEHTRIQWLIIALAEIRETQRRLDVLTREAKREHRCH